MLYPLALAVALDQCIGRFRLGTDLVALSGPSVEPVNEQRYDGVLMPILNKISRSQLAILPAYPYL